MAFAVRVRPRDVSMDTRAAPPTQNTATKKLKAAAGAAAVVYRQMGPRRSEVFSCLEDFQLCHHVVST